jgi:Tol biopolymer transport system component
MKKLLLPLLLLISIVGNAQDRMTPELLWSLKQVNGEGMSPDAKTVFYSARTYNVKTEKSTTKFYALNLKTGERSERKETKNVFQREEAVWYATDDKAIHKSSDKGQHWQSIYTNVEGIDNIRISPDGKYIAFTKDILIKPVLGKDLYPDLPKTTAHIYTDLTYRHWDTWEDGKFSHLFIAPISGGKAIDLMVNEPYDVPQKPFGGSEDFIWSPDSKGIVYVCKKKYGKEYAQSTNTDLYYYNIAQKQTTNLTANMMGYDMAPAFSPNGQYIAWTSMRREGYEADKNDIYVMDVKKRTALKLNLTQGWDGTVNGFIWSNDGKKILFSAPWEGTEQLFEVNFPGYTRMLPSVHKITEGKFDVNGLIGQSGNGQSNNTLPQELREPRWQ